MSEMNAAQQQAHYQAGQAVICITLFGARVIKNTALSNDPTDNSGFETYSRLPMPLSCKPPTHRRGEDRKPIAVEGIVDGHGVLAYSGVAAVYECLRRVGGSEDFDYHGYDRTAREGLSKLASSIGLERPCDHFYQEYWDEALRLLETHWDTVERVAVALVTHQSLNGNRMDELILGDDNP